MAAPVVDVSALTIPSGDLEDRVTEDGFEGGRTHVGPGSDADPGLTVAGRRQSAADEEGDLGRRRIVGHQRSDHPIARTYVWLPARDNPLVA